MAKFVLSQTISLSFEGADTTRRVQGRLRLPYITNSPSPLKERGIKVEDSSRGEVDNTIIFSLDNVKS